ncbi:tRNA glutamyl-Q(34) synthetase GluQRS [bacterium]|nr:tRNA glutamyl-Q(34) synthetase GluQRS [bacterium]
MQMTKRPPHPAGIFPPRTRFAPSPTGALHLGHAFSARVAAGAGGGRFVLRIDDIDHTRCRPRFTAQILDDLAWLGLRWHAPIAYQSDRMDAYSAALERLIELDLLYPCYLSRAEVNALLSAPHDDTATLVNTDHHLPADERARRAEAGSAPAWRLRTAAALAKTGPLSWHDALLDQDVSVNMGDFGDVVVARKDIGTSYHLSVVVDDALDGVTLVTRGADLANSTHVHRLLQALLGIESPGYLHHPLVTDATGTRLAKRNQATSLTALRGAGYSPDDVIDMMPEFLPFAPSRKGPDAI